MALFSPALVVAMCVMFVLTRLHRHYYIFEHPLLFGLKYCLEPLKDDIDKMMKKSSSSETTAQASNSGNKKKKNPQAASKNKSSSPSLTIRRSKLNELFFSTESEFPHHRELDHLMAIFCGYFAAFLFEGTCTCFFPGLLSNRRSLYVGIVGIGFSIWEALRISKSMTSGRTLLMLGGITWLIAMFITSAGDYHSFVRFDEAFSDFRQYVIFFLNKHLQFDEKKAASYARIGTVLARFFVATVAALISTSVAVPARHFSKLDYVMHQEYCEDEQALQGDPYYLGRPSVRAMFIIAMDYVIPTVTVCLWCIRPRGKGSYGGWRLSVLLLCVLIRIFNIRIRLQMYLDAAIDGYRSFWKDKASSNARAAGKQTAVHVISNSYFLLTITMAYVAPTIMLLVLILMAKLDGGVNLGICPKPSTSVILSNEIFAREIAGFLAWWCIASLVTFSIISVSYEALADVLDASGRDRRRMKLPPVTTSSERRKQKRLMREKAA